MGQGKYISGCPAPPPRTSKGSKRETTKHSSGPLLGAKQFCLNPCKGRAVAQGVQDATAWGQEQARMLQTQVFCYIKCRRQKTAKLQC